MQTTTQAIVLSALKYGDTSLIVKAFTASDGLKTYLLKGVLTSKKGKLKKAYFQPLTQLELVVGHRNRGTLEYLNEARVSYPYRSLHTDILKKTMSLFLAEVLMNSIHEEECNEPLFNYLRTSLQWLDMHDHIANFHILFLLELSKFLGFYPDTSDMHEPFFSMEEGRFTEATSMNLCLSGHELELFRRFLGINFDALDTIKAGKNERMLLLQFLLQYFEVHLHGFRKPRSLAILNEVFS